MCTRPARLPAAEVTHSLLRTSGPIALASLAGLGGNGTLLPSERDPGTHPALPAGRAAYDKENLRMLSDTRVAATGAKWGTAKP